MFPFWKGQKGKKIMCIAVYKAKGQKVPSKKIFSNCFNNNSHGAGIMFAYNGKVHIEKGLMSFTSFKSKLKDILKQYGGSNNGLDLDMVFHFRITSQGAVCTELTHPFPVCDDYNEMKKTSNVCDMAIAHNGIIDFASNWNVKDHNDTMEFIKNVAFNLIKGNKNYYLNTKTMAIMNYLLKGNRFAIMDGSGHTELIGDWIEDNGIYYSNTTYSYGKLKTTYNYDSKFWTNVGDYKKIDNKGDNKAKSTPTTSNAGKFLSKNQQDYLKKLGTCFCDNCGDEMIVYWDDKKFRYYAYCLGCHEEVEVPEDLYDYIQDDGYNYGGYGYDD